MLKKLDLYIIKKFLGTFIFSISLIIVIVIVFDVSEKIEDFIEKQAPLNKIVFEYYLNFIPYFVNLFSPLFVFIAVIFFTSKLSSNSEIIAILASGISFNRMLRPYFISAAILALFSFYLNNFLLPRANGVRLDFEEQYIRAKYSVHDQHIQRQIEPGTFIYFRSYNMDLQQGNRFSLKKFNGEELVYTVQANFLRYNDKIKKWQMHNYVIREINGMHEKITTGNVKDTTINLLPEDFFRRQNITERMNYFELKDFIANEEMRGGKNIVYYEIEMYRRMANPFATFILTVIGVAIASRKTKGGMGAHIGFGILLSFSYILFMQVSNTFATNSDLAPIIAVWIPNILYTFIAAFVLYKTPK